MSDILDRYPDLRTNPLAMATMCALLRDQGLHDDAFSLAQAAMKAAPESTGIRTDVAATLSVGVPIFHVPMLLDQARNQSYAEAIKRMVRPDMLVLEIGSGAGLLAMMCARAGARVVTCEENPIIAAAAAQIIERNGLADRITLIRKRSTLLTVPEDLPAPADLVIHEIFGSNLVCEGVTAALTDARARLLAPGAPSLPPRASVRCALVTEHMAPAAICLQDVEGFDLSLFEVFSRPSIALRKQRTQRLEPVTKPVSGLGLDFNSSPPFGPTTETIIVESSGGRVDGIVQWIALDFGNGVVLENDPFVAGPESSWGVPYTPLVKPIDTVAGEQLEIRLRRRGTLLTADVSRIQSADCA